MFLQKCRPKITKFTFEHSHHFLFPIKLQCNLTGNILQKRYLTGCIPSENTLIRRTTVRATGLYECYHHNTFNFLIAVFVYNLSLFLFVSYKTKHYQRCVVCLPQSVLLKTVSLTFRIDKFLSPLIFVC